MVYNHYVCYKCISWNLRGLTMVYNYVMVYHYVMVYNYRCLFTRWELTVILPRNRPAGHLHLLGGPSGM